MDKKKSNTYSSHFFLSVVVYFPYKFKICHFTVNFMAHCPILILNARLCSTRWSQGFFFLMIPNKPSNIKTGCSVSSYYGWFPCQLATNQNHLNRELNLKSCGIALITVGRLTERTLGGAFWQQPRQETVFQEEDDLTFTSLPLAPELVYPVYSNADPFDDSRTCFQAFAVVWRPVTLQELSGLPDPDWDHQRHPSLQNESLQVIQPQ